MRLRLLLAAVAAGLAVAPVAAGAAEQATATVGWWTRSPAQDAPEGGFAVATAPDGPLTVGAVGFDAGEGVTSAVLGAVETGGFGQAAAALQVCATSAPFEPAAGGALDDAPEPACDQGAVAFEREDAASSWTANITPLVADRAGPVAVVIVPGEEASPAFDVRFAAPVVTVEPAGDAAGSGGGFSDDGSFGGSPSSSPSGSSPSPSPSPSFTGGGGDFGGGSSSFSPPPLTAEPPSAETAPQPEVPTAADDETALGIGGTDETTGSFRPLGDTSEEGARWGQAAFFVVVSAAAAVAAGFANRWRRTSAVG